MRKLLIKPRARADLLEIWNYISTDNVAAANRLADSIDRAIRGPVQMTGKGHSRMDVTSEEYRFWNVYSCVIGYRYNKRVVEIVRVVHGRRNLRRLFK